MDEEVKLIRVFRGGQRTFVTQRGWWMTVRRGVLILIPALAVSAAVMPLSAEWVERVYSRRVYLVLQPWLTGFSNLTSFSLLDLLMVVGIGWWIAAAVVSARRHRGRVWRAISEIAVRSAVSAAALYLVFLTVWGLNYRRVPLASKLRVDPSAVSANAARLLAAEAVTNVNALYAASRIDGNDAASPDTLLAVAFAHAQTDLGATRLARPGRPKHTLLDLYFRGAGVEGMTDPYFLETLVAGGLLPFERPFVIAHEWAHLAGYADESEANFVGWLTCLHGSPRDRYSGWLYLYSEVASGLPRGVHPGADLEPGPRADLRAIAKRVSREVQPLVAEAGWRVYDRYLKANRVEAGTASYANVVRLILATRFESDWRPELKPIER